MDKRIVMLFSGQGSHYRGMGQQLYEQHAIFRRSLEKSERIIQRMLHRSIIRELYYQQPDAPFDDLLITHPAIVAVEIALFDTLRALDIVPACVSGNSLGEFAAGVAAGIWSADAAIEAALEQAKSILRHDIEGGMLVVLTEKENVWPLYEHYHLFLAADNFPGHFTLAGTAVQLDLFQVELSLNGISFVRLPVTCPFHSPLINIARNDYALYTAATTLNKPAISFVSGYMGKELPALTTNYFWEAVSRFSSFSHTVSTTEAKGPCFYIDMGPSGASATMLKYNLPATSQAGIFQIMSPFKREMEQLKKLQAMIQ
ncbi:acyltransferase domain-containing protein [Chitinophaga pendula]|uniref:acyltransferase domain-containing protein n=1 Tax=Chitinophaga TaxID=79328 RepID=UPI000BAEB9F5|nr:MULTISPECIES: acyltransferase domain-containing protein [Chitinophaga]ASZ12603.1 hypothetical protein CK934_17385 [Chitinophaga sp. MD30]UCJ09793.1 acyltransferase domain-containing protein [Chitinophaga pendula]